MNAWKNRRSGISQAQSRPLRRFYKKIILKQWQRLVGHIHSTLFPKGIWPGAGGVMRKSVLIVALVSMLVLVFASAYSQEDMEVVSNEAFDDPQRPPATFYHDTHNEAAGLDDCNECHHIYDEAGVKSEDESSEDQACSECHGDADEGSKPGLMKAYHLNCKGCHLSEKKGPILCATCHVKS
jgi:hypothetical protein